MEDYTPYNNEADHDLVRVASYHIGIINHHMKEITKLLEKHAITKEDTNVRENRQGTTG